MRLTTSIPIVHRDVTTVNVLLDVSLDPKLYDFRSTRVEFSSAVRSASPIIGSPSYIDPHYLETRMLSKSIDVYSFGVLLLELITGLPTVESKEGRVSTADMGPREERIEGNQKERKMLRS